MGEAIEAGGHVTLVRRLGGGLGASTFAIDIRTVAGTRLAVVLKRTRVEALMARVSGVGSNARESWARRHRGRLHSTTRDIGSTRPRLS